MNAHVVLVVRHLVLDPCPLLGHPDEPRPTGVAMGEGLHRPGVVALPHHLPCQDWVCGTRVVDYDHVGQEGALALTAGPEACLTMRLTSLGYGQAQALAWV